MITIRKIFFAVIFILIPIEYIYGDCPFCGREGTASSCECETKFKDILEKLQSHSGAASPIAINQQARTIEFSQPSMSHGASGFEITLTSHSHGSFQLKPLCSISDLLASMDHSVIGQFLYTCQCIVNATDLLKKMLTNMSTQNISDLSTNIEWSVAFTDAFAAFTSNQQHNLYYWVNAVNSDGASNEWIFIVISSHSQTDNPCFSIMQLSSGNLLFHQETDMSKVMAFLSVNLVNKTINRSGHFK